MHFFKFITLFLFFTLVVSQTYSQTISVYDKDTKEPLEFVNLIREDAQFYALTNADGESDLTGFIDAEVIVIRSFGFKTIQMSYSEVEAADFKVYLQSTNLNLDEVVVSATRWKASSSSIPSKIISVSPKTVAFQNPQTAADMLGISGKVYIQKSQQGGGSPMIRGFSTNRLLYTIDGIRMNTAIFRSGNIQNVINMDPFAIESTEVLFGPGSVMYGSDAIGGVMSFQTLTPQLAISDTILVSGKSTIRYSTANQEKTGHFDVNLGWKKWSLVSSFTSWDYGHLRQGNNGPEEYLKYYHVQRIDSVDRVFIQDNELLQIPTAYSQINTMHKLRFKPNSKWDFQYGFHYSSTSTYGRYDRHNRITDDGDPKYAEWNYGPQRWLMNHLSVKYLHGNKLFDQMTLKLAQQSFEESRIVRLFNDDLRSTQEEQVLALSLNADFLKKVGENHILNYGVEYVANDVLSDGNITDISTGITEVGAPRYPESLWQSMAAFVNDQMKLGEQVTIQAGLRYNYFILDAAFDTALFDLPFHSAKLHRAALTGSLGAVYRPSPTWVMNVNLGTAFRSPNVDDMGKVFDPVEGAVTVPNPYLRSEYAYNIDAGVAKVFADFIKVEVTGFYTQLSNAMVRRDFTLNGEDSIIYQGEWSQVQAIQNAAAAYVMGIQAGLEVRLPASFSFSSDINYQIGEEELDGGGTSPIRHAAPMFGNARLKYHARKLDLELNVMYQVERDYEDMPENEKDKPEIYAIDGDGNPYAAGWYTINFKAMYRFTEHLTIMSGVENLTDQRYRPYSSGISGAGRNFIFSLRANF